ncbi:hypothetical protein AB4Z54_11065 [Streptomyces sp. MCAF7]
MSADLGLMHRKHRWLGRVVTDTVTGRRGILRAVAPDGTNPRPVAWMWPAEGGGLEWTTDLLALADPAPVTPDTHPKGEQ